MTEKGIAREEGGRNGKGVSDVQEKERHELALEFFGGFDFRLGYAKGVAVVYVELHFVEDVGDDFVGLDGC
jgi:hypothetical protein